LNLNLTFDYTFITDPPILADIGEAYLGVDEMALAINLNTTYNTTDEVLAVWLGDVHLEFGKSPLAIFDGLSDFSEVVTGLVDTFGAIIRNRLASIINEQLFTSKINTLLNALLALAPQDLDIPGTEFYLDGLLYSNIEFVTNPAMNATFQYIDIPLMTVIQKNNSTPFTHDCETVIPDFNMSSPFEVRIQITDCVLNSILYAVQESDMLHGSIANAALTTSLTS